MNYIITSYAELDFVFDKTRTYFIPVKNFHSRSIPPEANSGSLSGHGSIVEVEVEVVGTKEVNVCLKTFSW